jgi:hypothetical protein
MGFATYTSEPQAPLRTRASCDAFSVYVHGSLVFEKSPSRAHVRDASSGFRYELYR